MPIRRRPVGALLSGLAALVFAAPTLVFPADSPTQPKLAFAVVGAVLFVVAVVRVRGESADADRSSPDDGPVNGE